MNIRPVPNNPDNLLRQCGRAVQRVVQFLAISMAGWLKFIRERTISRPKPFVLGRRGLNSRPTKNIHPLGQVLSRTGPTLSTLGRPRSSPRNLAGGVVVRVTRKGNKIVSTVYITKESARPTAHKRPNNQRVIKTAPHPDTAGQLPTPAPSNKVEKHAPLLLHTEPA